MASDLEVNREMVLDGTATRPTHLWSAATDTWLALVLAALGVTLRLIWIHYFPTTPVSDFANVVAFAEAFARHPAATGFGLWDMFNPGTSLLLSLPLRTGIGAPAAVSRVVTAVFVGLLPLLPFLIWRGVLPLWARMAAALSLAVWPGQIAFSGVVAQDNWAIGPAVALGCLACRTILGRPAHPWLAGLLLGLAFLVRQEMMAALAPLALAGAGVLTGGARRKHNAVVLAGTLALCLLFAAELRYLGSGRFAISTTHGALATLASTVPGSSWGYNAPPYSYLETFAPGQDPRQVAFRLVGQEFARRPLYHAVRLAYFSLAPLLRSSGESLYWSIGSEALPEAYRRRAAAALGMLQQPLTWEMRAVVWAGFASLFLAVASRNVAALLLASSVILKLAIHAVTVSQPRYYYPVTALILLAVPIAAAHPSRRRWRLLAWAALAAVPSTVGLVTLTGAAERWTRAHDTPIGYRFEIAANSGATRARCATSNAGIWSWYPRPDEKAVSFFRPDPEVGEVGEISCDLPAGPRQRAATLEVQVPAIKGYPDHFRLTAAGDGVGPVEVDPGRPFPGQLVELPMRPGSRSHVTIRLQVLRRDPGQSLGHAVRLVLRLRTTESLAITYTSPAVVRTREKFNIQPCGESAIAVIGRGFAPGDKIVWNRIILPTTYGHSSLLTAIVPDHLYRRPGTVILKVRDAEYALEIKH